MPTPGMWRCETLAGWSNSWPQPSPCATCSRPEQWSLAGFGVQQGQDPFLAVPCLLQQVAKVWTSAPAGPGRAWRCWGFGRSRWGPEAPPPCWAKPGDPWRRGWHRLLPRRWPGPGAGGSSGRGWPTRAGRRRRSHSRTVCHMWNSEGSGSCGRWKKEKGQRGGRGYGINDRMEEKGREIKIGCWIGAENHYGMIQWIDQLYCSGIVEWQHKQAIKE